MFQFHIPERAMNNIKSITKLFLIFISNTQSLPKASIVPKPAAPPPEKEKEAAPKPAMSSGARHWNYGTVT